MATNEKHLTYRGDVRAVSPFGKGLAFTTVHPEGRPSALYRLDVETLELSEIPLECGGLCLAVAGDSLYLGGDDARLYCLKGKSKLLSPLKAKMPAAATALAMLSAGRLAAICGERVVILDAETAKETQTIELEETATALASSPEGEWLAVGTGNGVVSVYECEEKDAFQISESAKLHDGAVTSILFEPEELRFFSAGADQKLLLTHARGKLEPEDRGRTAGHSDVVTAMLHVPGERFITVSRDRTCKTWARAGATRPATFDDAVPAVVDADLVEMHGRPHLVIAGDDNTLRFILLEPNGRFSGMTHRLYDAYDRAAHLLDDTDVARRGDALHALAEYDDARAVELIASQVQQDADHGLRLRATELLSKSRHPRSARLLEPLLKHDDEKVRQQAFEGLRNAAEKEDLRPLELAFSAKKADVGVAAVRALEPLAKKDDLARQLLIRTLDGNVEEVRRAALLSLEKVFSKNSPEAALIAVKSRKSDVRRLALIRCLQRELLDDARVQGAVRRGGEDKNADVRRTAFLIALLSRPKLAKAIRERDPDLHRQLFELEQFDVDPKKKTKSKQPPKLKPVKFSLDADDEQPLLSAMASRAMDTCLSGTCCLALLGDPRAFGTLLQLSREEDAAARVQVCRALSQLADERATQRLETLLNDDAEEVRDAAYSALEVIRKPLEAADVGLQSSYVGVRRRALKTLSATLRKGKKKSLPDEARGLILRALNDADDGISGEAFKTALGLKVDGSHEATLRFALQSVRPHVRGEVATEAMAHDKQDWARNLLLNLLNDADSQIREDAYDHLLKQGKGRDLDLLRTALESRHADIRLRATRNLIKLKTKAAQEALVAALDDEDREVRTEAVDALIEIEADDAIRRAMSSEHTDVRLRAAGERAWHNDNDAKAPLIEAATAPEPEKEDDKKQWLRNVEVAVDGLGTLGLEEFIPVLMPLLDSRHDSIRKAVAGALACCARASQIETLKPALQHSDNAVSAGIAIGLALCRDSTALSIVFSNATADVLEDGARLIAAVGYGPAAEPYVVSLLDSDEPWVRNAAFLVLLLRDWKSHNGTPARILAALSARDPRTRLAAALALQAFADREALTNRLVRFVNDRGEEQAWTITEEQINVLADAVVFGEPHCAGQFVANLQHLAAEKQEEWDYAWHILETRWAGEIETAEKAAKKHKPPKLSTSADELSQLAFGTYVGLVREQGSYHERGERPVFGSTVVGIRQTAMRRLVAMAEADETVVDAVRPVLIQALGDNLQAVRTLAFELLAKVGVDDENRAAAAIECGHTDLAVAALKLLTSGTGKQGQKILEDVVRTRDDDLATEAGGLLMRMTDAVTAGNAGLESPHKPTRLLAVGWLAGAYDDSAKAKTALVKAYESRYEAVRRAAAIALAMKKDKHAFDMLFEQLDAANDKRDQAKLLEAIAALGDPRSPDALLDALEQDADRSLEPVSIIRAVGSFRDPQIAARLLALLERKEWRTPVAEALIVISGHDQSCPDPDDELTGRDWMRKQHPRHDEVLAGYLERCLELNLPELIAPRIAAARWSLSDAVDEVMALLSVHPDADLRHAVVEAIGWRFRKRKGPAEPLVSLLEHRDATTKFLAAVGLARGGRGDGINVLLSAVELLADLSQRQLAVRALGELADERAFDMLLRLASEDGHALQDTAAEAIGHLGRSEQADDIFQLLKRLANSGGTVSARAIVGLRWFNTPAGWDLIREKARRHVDYDDDALIALQQLGHNDEPASRTLMLDGLRSHWPHEILPAARRLFGDDSLEPDYAALESDNYWPECDAESRFHCLERVCRDGDAGKIFAILATTQCASVLSDALMRRDPPPIEAAAEAIVGASETGVEVAASIVGQSGKKEQGKHLGPAIEKWAAEWNNRLRDIIRSGNWWYLEYEVGDVTRTLSRLCWAAGRTQSAKGELFALLETNESVSQFQDVRRSAITALAECRLTKAELSKIEKRLDDADATIRATATEIIARQDSERAAKRAGELVSDRALFNRIASRDDIDVAKIANESAEHAHYQAVVLPQLVAAGDVKRLSEVAGNGELGEATRLGAVEGLAKVAKPSADKLLVTIGKDDTAGEEIRKAAWRSLRRSRRAQAASGK